MNRLLKCLLIIFIAVALTSCAATKWEMNIANQADLRWPPPPNPVKASYLGEIKSFVPTGTSLVSVLFGRSESGKIKKPVAIALGDDGRIAIADPKSKGVHFFVPSTQKYKLITGFAKEQLISPVSVVFDEDLRLYISDSVLGKVLVYDQNGNNIGELMAAGKSSLQKQQFLQRPTGLAYLPGKDLLFVADTLGHEIHIFNTEGQHLHSFGDRGIEEAEFNMPTHLAATSDGKIMVNDAMNFRLQLFDSEGVFVSGFGHHGDGSGDFGMPKGIAADRWGVIYVAETLFDVVQLFNDKGEYLMSIGGKGTGLGEFWMPSGIFVDRHDRLYVCDTYNKRIQVFQLHDSSGGGVK